jgi:hypothetical protein
MKTYQTLAHVVLATDQRGGAYCGARLSGTLRLRVELDDYTRLRRWWTRRGWTSEDGQEAVPGICPYCDLAIRWSSRGGERKRSLSTTPGYRHGWSSYWGG